MFNKFNFLHTLGIFLFGYFIIFGYSFDKSVFIFIGVAILVHILISYLIPEGIKINRDIKYDFRTKHHFYKFTNSGFKDVLSNNLFLFKDIKKIEIIRPGINTYGESVDNKNKEDKEILISFKDKRLHLLFKNNKILNSFLEELRIRNVKFD